MNVMRQSVLKMSAVVEEAMNKAVAALSAKDEALAREVIENDRVIDEMQISIEDQCAVLIATEQPVATDLRDILTAIKLAADLERIGDHARHLARAVAKIGDSPYFQVVPHIEKMAARGVGMVHDALTAFVEHNADQAREVAARDDDIDKMYKTLHRQVLDIMEQNPGTMDRGIDLMFLARFLERLGDHVTNMCEWIVYSRRGTHIELNP